jgi:hypothetical protein
MRPRVSESIGIYQPLFHESVGPFLDPGFITLDWRHNPSPHLREFALHQHICEAEVYKDHGLTGLLSPKFFSKTGLRSHDVINWINANPGREVYCINGRPFAPYVSYNSIERAARLHPPDFEGRLRRLFSFLELDLPAELDRQTVQQTVLCNFWIATPSFWERWWREVVQPISMLAQSDETPARELFTETNHRSPTSVFLVVFIYERVMSYYISIRAIEAAVFPFSKDQLFGLDYDPQMRRYLECMVPWIDEIDKSGNWRYQERAKLMDAYDQLVCGNADIAAHEVKAFDPLNFDLPARAPNNIGLHPAPKTPS